jgi:hypothetical protein
MGFVGYVLLPLYRLREWDKAGLDMAGKRKAATAAGN